MCTSYFLQPLPWVSDVANASGCWRKVCPRLHVFISSFGWPVFFISSLGVEISVWFWAGIKLRDTRSVYTTACDVYYVCPLPSIPFTANYFYYTDIPPKPQRHSALDFRCLRLSLPLLPPNLPVVTTHSSFPILTTYSSLPILTTCPHDADFDS